MYLGYFTIFFLKGLAFLFENSYIFFLLTMFVSCSSIEKKDWKDKYVFLAYTGNLPVIELVGYPSEKNYAPPAKLRLLLDTGSNLSFLRREFLPTKKSSEKYISYTISGASEINIHKLNIELETPNGEKLTSEQVFHMIEFRKDFPFDGILGNDFLQKYTLLYSHSEGIYIFNNDPKDIEKDFTSITILNDVKSHLVIPVELEKTLLYFLLDTGAEISYIDEDHVKKLNIDAHTTRKYTNFTGEIRESSTYILPSLCLQEKFCSKNIELLANQNLRNFLGQSNIKVSGLFGMNWLKNYYLLVKYPDRKVYLKSKNI